jgi:hypothetical protein
MKIHVITSSKTPVHKENCNKTITTLVHKNNVKTIKSQNL